MLADGSIFVGSLGGLPVAFRHAIIDAGGARRRHAHMTGITGVLGMLYYDAATGSVDYISGGMNRPMADLAGWGPASLATGMGAAVPMSVVAALLWHDLRVSFAEQLFAGVLAAGFLLRQGAAVLEGH